MKYHFKWCLFIPLKKPASEALACLPVSMSIQGLKKFGLGESFGKASLANTAFELGRFISMSDRSSWIGEGGYRNPSEAWPDEALERGFAQTLGEEREKLGEGWLRIDRIFITVIG